MGDDAPAEMKTPGGDGVMLPPDAKDTSSSNEDTGGAGSKAVEARYEDWASPQRPVEIARWLVRPLE